MYSLLLSICTLVEASKHPMMMKIEKNLLHNNKTIKSVGHCNIHGLL